jgi:hypothetical protein
MYKAKNRLMKSEGKEFMPGEKIKAFRAEQ